MGSDWTQPVEREHREVSLGTRDQRANVVVKTGGERAANRRGPEGVAHAVGRGRIGILGLGGGERSAR